MLYNISQALPHSNVLFSLCLMKQRFKVSTGALQHSCYVAVTLRAIGDACSLRRSDDSLENLFMCNRQCGRESWHLGFQSWSWLATAVNRGSVRAVVNRGSLQSCLLFV